MNDLPVLGQVALGYSPMIDRHKAITALRLTVFPVRPDTMPDVDALLAALDAPGVQGLAHVPACAAVLVKGSRFMRMEQVVQALVAQASTVEGKPHAA